MKESKSSNLPLVEMYGASKGSVQILEVNYKLQDGQLIDFWNDR